jgi:spermidine synthase
MKIYGIVYSRRKEGIHALTLIFVFLFFLSGATGLIYEMVWVRLFTIVFGNTTYGVSAVLTAFMAGLGMGSYVFGRLIDRKRNPLLIYATLELGIGLSALAMPHILLVLQGFYSAIYNQFPSSVWLLQVIRTGLSFVILFVPTFLMGATLPVLTKFLAQRNIRAGRTIGVLYAANTLGATTGCLLSGLVLFKIFGLEKSTYISAVLNFILAGGFLLLNRFSAGARNSEMSGIPERPKDQAPRVSTSEISPFAQNVLLACFALAGFTSLAYEVLWFRLLVFQMQTTVYAFTAMLTTFLAGIGIGSALFAIIDKRQRSSVQYWTPFAYLEIAIGVLGLLSIVLLGSFGPLISQLSYTFWKFFGLLFASSSMIMLLPTVLMGIAFPMVCKIYSQNAGQIGSIVGRVYAWNTIGSIFGSFITGFFLVRLLGTQVSLILISLCNFLIATIILAISPKAEQPAATAREGRGKKELPRTTIKPGWVIAMLWLLPVVIIVFIPGDFLFQYYNTGEKRQNAQAEILHAEEGVQGITTVHRYPEGYRVISTGSINVAGTSFTLRTTQILQGHIPMLLHPDAKQVLQVGFGSGETAHIVTQYANVVQHDTVEISQSVIDSSARFFQDINHDVVKHPKFHPIIMDGANYLRLTRKKYDVIMNDSTRYGHSMQAIRGFIRRDISRQGGII